MTGTILTWIGVAIAVVGVALLVGCIRRAARLRRMDPPPPSMDAEFRLLIAWNAGAVGLGFLGIGVMVVGLLM